MMKLANSPVHSLRVLLIAKLCASLVLVAALAGCAPTATDVTQDAPTSEAKDSPATFAEALQQLANHKASIQTAFEKSDPESAHDDLHAIGHVIEAIPELAKKAGIGEADMPAVQAAVESLFEAFGKLDESLHGGDKTPYKDVAEKIDTALATLNKMATK